MSLPSWAPADESETVVWAGQPRSRVVLQGIAVGLGAAVVVAGSVFAFGGVLGSARLPLAIVLGLAALAVPTASVWLWRRTTEYLLTDAALYHRTGVLSISVTELRLNKVQNTNYTQGVLGTVFDHGTVTIDTAGSQGAELTLRALDGPQAVHQQIAERVGVATGERDAIPGTVDQWRAVRSEVRRLRAALGGE
jgi:uncharacterized membrane protein YdbT with pleckstrin-like domain